MLQEQVDYISEYWFNMNGAFELTDVGRGKVVLLLKQFTLQEILDAIDIAIVRYYKGNKRSAGFTFDKIGGICYNRRHQITGKEGD